MTKTYPVVVSVAGSDSGGGAGIQADLKTMAALGVYGATVITAVTAQNTKGVIAIHAIPNDIFQKQLNAVFDDFEVDTVKIGMLHDPEIVDILIHALEKYKPKYVVVDPVMVATSGDPLILKPTIDALKTGLFPLASLITPNLKETALLLEREVNNVEDMKKAAFDLLSFGSKAVLVKGGHLQDKIISDVLWLQGENQAHTFDADYIQTENLHGTGCTLSSAIASYLALGYTLIQAVSLAKQYVSQAILYGRDVTIGHGHGPLNHAFNPQKLKINEKNN
ncbi:MAG: bifunctional hydroxymethylpyrimidine kinase/phosphomethylpyrimidine kinase [Bacteroidales bacterium]|nr:bifunctional hydroxymethylpyrimidine kinase/phosphomethylpyrimidine kinase [Bacteroidales bacterium]